MAKNALPKRMFKNTEVASRFETDRSPKTLMKQMARDHLDVLQNIEFMLVTAFHEEPRIDDQVVREALLSVIRRSEPTEPLVVQVRSRLDAMRDHRTDIDDSVWLAAVRVIEDSVRTHSTGKPRDRGYLEFVENYVR